MKSESPASKIRKRFMKNKLAVFGLIIICISFFVAVFCYLLMPDRTPMANRMNLSICNQPPGLTVTMIMMNKKPVSETGWITSLFEGTPSSADYIPVSSWQLNGTDLKYNEFTGDSLIKGRERHINLADAGNTAAAFDVEKHLRLQKFVLGTDRYGRDLLSRLLAA